MLELPLRDHGGRSLEFRRAVCDVEGRFELPKPCGARPESVTLRCAFQERPEFDGRAVFELPLTEPFGREEKLAGGRLAESCDWRALLRFCAPLKPRAKLPAEVLPGRLPEKPEELNACEGRCEAAAAGVERVTTLRFCTLAEGVAMRPCMLEAPL